MFLVYLLLLLMKYSLPFLVVKQKFYPEFCIALCFPGALLTDGSDETGMSCVARPLIWVLLVAKLKYFDTVDWVTKKASVLWKTEWWYVGGSDLTGALHVTLGARSLGLSTASAQCLCLTKRLFHSSVHGSVISCSSKILNSGTRLPRLSWKLANNMSVVVV